MTWLQVHGHYSERVPLWTELKDLFGIAAMALVLEGFLQFAFKADISRMWILVTWFLFPAFSILLRSSVKRLLTRAGAWLIPTMIFGRRDDAEQVGAALAGETMLGFRIVGAAGVGSPEQAFEGMRNSAAASP